MDLSELQKGVMVVAVVLALTASGCSTTSPCWVDQPWTPLTFEQSTSSDAIPVTDATNQFQSVSYGRAATDETQNQPARTSPVIAPVIAPMIAQVQYQETVRGQDGGYPLNENGSAPGQTTNPATTSQTGQYVPTNQQSGSPQRYPLHPMPAAQIPTPPSS